VKRRKAHLVDEPANSGEVRNLPGTGCVVATRGTRSS